MKVLYWLRLILLSLAGLAFVSALIQHGPTDALTTLLGWTIIYCAIYIPVWIIVQVSRWLRRKPVTPSATARPAKNVAVAD